MIDDVVIWAKLTQGNSRGTCCWITHILNSFRKIFLNKFKSKKLRYVALSGCLDVK